jgi:hypothetical protein
MNTFQLYFYIAAKVRDCKYGADVVWAGPFIGYYIAGSDMVTLNSMDIDECKKACLQQQKFNCLSFDYIRSSKTCYLQSVRR